MYSAYKNVHPSAKSYAVSSPDGSKRHMVSGPPLPGLSSMLQRSPEDAFMLSPRSPAQASPSTSSEGDPEQLTKLYNNTVFQSGLQARQAAASAVARALAPTASKASRPLTSPPPTTSSSCSPPPTTTTTTTCTTKPVTVPPAPVEKSSRYLREIDRRAILSRIEQGEKQSALAKEYQVSRAAICNLNKHRDEVLSRKNGNPLAKHPKKPRPKTMKAKLGKSGWAAAMALTETAATEHKGVHEIKSRAAALLLTTLRKKHATVSEFRRASDRLMRLVMEEALAYVPVKTVEIFLPNHSKSDGVALEHPPRRAT
ncbi:putative uracil phosphoribosyltransferase [Phytophthora cinnamomi]|uniref:putative uracil phosphoribosyltransferase n=1 Tax=Phytophthora cinnamomi TaxID=4785 RepID=UPI00355A3868|nr:putative uracil phosphoribosyltransferase [Phytophthora cinnamomi]